MLRPSATELGKVCPLRARVLGRNVRREPRNVNVDVTHSSLTYLPVCDRILLGIQVVGPEHTFLFADLGGFTALAETEGDDPALEVALTLQRRVGDLLQDHLAEQVRRSATA